MHDIDLRLVAFFPLLALAISLRSGTILLITTGLTMLVALIQLMIKRSTLTPATTGRMQARRRHEARRKRVLIIYALLFGYIAVYLSPSSYAAGLIGWVLLAIAGCIHVWYLREEASQLK